MQEKKIIRKLSHTDENIRRTCIHLQTLNNRVVFEEYIAIIQYCPAIDVLIGKAYLSKMTVF